MFQGRTPSHRVSLIGLLCLAGCAELESPPDPPSFRTAAASPQDVGSRLPHLQPVFTAEGVCPAEVFCSASDHNGDGQMDLVRRDPRGVFGPPGNVMIAMAHGWGYGSFRALAQGCPAGTLCFVADLDGTRGAELLRVEPKIGKVTRFDAGSDGLLTEATELVAKGFCQGPNPRCNLMRNDDGGLQLAWLDSEGGLRTMGTAKGDTAPQMLETSCEPGMHCRLAEADGRPGAELLVWDTSGADGILAMVRDKDNGESRWLPVACGANDCEFAEIDGDGLVDVLQRGDAIPRWWTSRFAWNVPFEADQGAVCGADERCLWADGNGDGFDDLLRIEPGGTLTFHPSLDARGRLALAAMELSTFATDQARAEFAQSNGGLRDLLATIAPSRAQPIYHADAAPIDAKVYGERHDALVERIEALVSELLAAVPSESDTRTDADVRRVRELALHVVAARTVLAAAPLGVSHRGSGDCGNVVLHDRAIVDGLEHRAPSYLFRFARAQAQADREARAKEQVGVLTAVTAGFRCLNDDEVVLFDAAFSHAVLETAAELRESGRLLASKWVIDSALPVVLLSFDAAKYHAVPPSYSLLTANVIDGINGGLLPTEGFDFDAAAQDEFCRTFACQTYGIREYLGDRGLELDQLGVWLPDPMSSGRLTRVDVDAHELLSRMRDLRLFGEGDCSLLEVATHGFTCPSRATCQSEALAVDPLAGIAIPPGLEVLAPRIGDLGSSFTHLFTPRGPDLSRRNGCDGGDGGGQGGGAAMPGCMGPPLGSRAGHFSPDPELDALMRCAMDTASAPVDTALHLGRGCFTGQDAPDAPEPPDDDESEPPANPYEPTAANLVAAYPSIRQQVADVLRHGETIEVDGFSYSRDQLVAGLRTAFSGLSSMTDENITALLSGEVADAVERAPIRSTPGALGETRSRANGVGMTVDPAQHAGRVDPFGEVARTLLHEGVHVFLFHASARGWVPHDATFDARHHKVITRLGLQLCDSSTDCSSSCGTDDAIFQRFLSCVEPAPPIDPSDIVCEATRDACDDRQLGVLGASLSGECLPSYSIAPEPECLVVNCGVDVGTLAGRCCGAEEAQWNGSIPAFELDIGPGPCPEALFEAYADGWPDFAL